MKGTMAADALQKAISQGVPIEGDKSEKEITDNLMGRIVYGPDQLAQASMKRLRQLSTERYLFRCPYPGLGEQFLPIEGGKVTLVNAQSHNGKSMFLDYWARTLANEMVGDDYIVWLDFENFAEEVASAQLFHNTSFNERDLLLKKKSVDWNEAYRALSGILKPNIIRITASVDDVGAMSAMTISNIRRVLHRIQNGGYNGRKINIRAIFADYLQVFPYDPENAKVRRTKGEGIARRLQIADDFNQLFLMAREFECAMIIATQARENLRNNSGIFMPTYFEIHESTDPARRADNVICLSMPKVNYNPGDIVKYEYRGEKYNFEANSDIMFVKLGKQRAIGAASGGVWMLKWDYNTYTPYLTQPNRGDGGLVNSFTGEEDDFSLFD